MITDRYYFHQLNEKDQHIYRTIYESLIHFQDEVFFNEHLPQDAAALMRLRKAVELDNPFLYYWDTTCEASVSFNAGGFISSCRERYYIEQEVVRKVNSQIEAVGNRIIRELGISHASAEEKVKAIHDYFCTHTQYQHSALNNTDIAHNFNAHTMLGIFSTGKAVCNGISKAVKFLLNALDIPCIIVHGYTGTPEEIRSKANYHAWNIIRFGNDCYNADFTWDNNTSDKDFISYNYYLVPDAVFNLNHESSAGLPACTALKEYYFIKNNLNFKTRGEAQQYISRSLSAGKRRLYFRLEESIQQPALSDWLSYVIQHTTVPGSPILSANVTAFDPLNIVRVDL